MKDITKGMEMKKITRTKEKVQVSRKDTKEALLHHNPLHPELALKVLGQICNGQNRVMQVVFFITHTVHILYVFLYSHMLHTVRYCHYPVLIELLS